MYNYPNKLSYKEIERISVLYKKRFYEIKIYHNQNEKPILLLTNTIDDNIFNFLEGNKVQIEKLNF